jgi:hypothetical protein
MKFDVKTSAILIEDCPRCGAGNMTFDVTDEFPVDMMYGWQFISELFSTCRNCHRPTVFKVGKKSYDVDLPDHKYLGVIHDLNNAVQLYGYVSLKDLAAASPPEHCPKDVDSAFREGATCIAAQCHNAAAAMFRLCVDLATRPMVPQEETLGLNHRTRRDFGVAIGVAIR